MILYKKQIIHELYHLLKILYQARIKVIFLLCSQRFYYNICNSQCIPNIELDYW